MCIDSSIYIGIYVGICIHRPGARRRDRPTARAAVLTLYITLHYITLLYIILYYVTLHYIILHYQALVAATGRQLAESRRPSAQQIAPRVTACQGDIT